MPKSDRLSSFLPLRFNNGQTISRFAKHCVRCNALVTATDMQGVASTIQNRIVIAAKARCPQCQAEFAVTCVITDDKQVHKVMLPYWMLRWWLLRTPMPPVAGVPSRSSDWEYSPDATTDQPSESLMPPPVDNRVMTPSGETLGQFDGAPIPAWLNVDGERYDFVRPVVGRSASQLAHDEVCYEQRLVYRRSRQAN